MPQGTSTHFFADGAFYGYDLLSQAFATTIGDTYDISFWLADSIILGYSRIDTSGYDPAVLNGNGNANNVVVYGPNPVELSRHLSRFSASAWLGWPGFRAPPSGVILAGFVRRVYTSAYGGVRNQKGRHQPVPPFSYHALLTSNANIASK